MTPYPTAPGTALFLPVADGASVPGGFRLGARIDTALPKRDPHRGEPLPLLPFPFDALLFGTGPVETPPGAILLGGTQHIVKPGDGDLLVVLLARRRAGLSHAAFRERWLNGHAPFGIAIDAAGYRQLHPKAEPDADGFDGAGLVFFRDAAHAAASRAAPEIARDATADEMQFIDHGRSMLAMFRMTGDRG
jgi:EthD domain